MAQPAKTILWVDDEAELLELLVVDVTARPETSVEMLEEAVNRELDRMLTEGVTPQEVARAVTLIETELVATLQSAGERADKLSMFATYFGDPAIVNQQADRYRAVTAERVNAFVRARLMRENRASLLYIPREAETEPTQSDLAMAETP